MESILIGGVSEKGTRESKIVLLDNHLLFLPG
jgi:hypothetical protein